MKISEILKLTPEHISKVEPWFFGENYLFQDIYVNSEDDFVEGFLDRLRVYKYSCGECHSDDRSREVCIVFIDDVPSMFYQIVGKDHEHSNIKVLNKYFISEVYSNYKGGTTFETVDLDYDVTLEGYGMTYSIVNNKLYWKY